MKKKVLLKPYYGKMFLDNRIFKNKTTHNPFFGLKKRFEKLGIEINTVDKKNNNPNYYIYCDVPYPWEIKNVFMMFKNRKKNILFTFESPLINPLSQLKFFHIFFKKIYTWNDELIVDAKSKYKKFYFPQNLQDVVRNQTPFEKKKLVIMINSYKKAPFLFKLLSRNEEDYYVKREKVAAFLSKNYPNDFDLYGKKWNIKSTSYKGLLSGSKRIKLSKYKYCICFENTSAPGYITEKIFDCFLAKCVPIYLGPKNISKYIPTNTYIDFNKFKSNQELLKYLISLNKVEYNKYINNAEHFVNDEKAIRLWSSQNFENILVDEVKL